MFEGKPSEKKEEEEGRRRKKIDKRSKEDIIDQ